MCRSAVNDGSCSPWVMCSCSVMRGNQVRDTRKSGRSECSVRVALIMALSNRQIFL